MPNAAEWVRQSLGRRRLSALVTLAVGFLAGVVVASLLSPGGTRVVTAGAGSGASGVGGAPGAGGAGGAGGPAGTPGTVAGGGITATPAGVASATAPGSSGGGGGAPGGGTAGAPAAGAGGGAAGTSGGGATAPGVTASTITVGFGLPDIGPIAALGPGYNQGNPQQYVSAILAQLHDEHRLPVNGRDIRPVYSTYNILSQDAQRATCEAFGAGQVFAVVAIHDFGVGNDCVAGEHHLPILTSDGQLGSDYQQSWPNLFTLQMSEDRMLRNFAVWADRAGYLKDSRIGVYYSDDAATAQVVQSSLIQPLAHLGHPVVSQVETSSTDASTGGPEDSVAVERFHASGVNVAILLVSALAKTNFFNQAQTQGYHPLFLENDLGFSTTNTATSTYPVSYFNGTPAFTGLHFGEAAAGIPEDPEAQWCVHAVTSHGGQGLDRNSQEAAFIAANQACDEVQLLLSALQSAGPDLTRARFIAGLETTNQREMGIHGNVTFNAQKHDGGAAWRQLTWKATCKCWVAQGTFSPLFVP